jgi:alpha-ketoglutarate-dependent taurine dioxygenase
MAAPLSQQTDAPARSLATPGVAAPTQPLAAPEVAGPRLSPAGGVVIDGVELSQTMTPAVLDRILAAFREHHIVVFRGQTLSREQQFAFAANFGEVEHSSKHPPENKRYAVAHVISNLDGNGNPVDRSASPVSNYRWHTDKSYFRVPPMLTMLRAVEVPPDGGDTEFANTAMAYAALSDAVKRRLTGLCVVFYWGAGQVSGGMASPGPGPGAQTREMVDHPLVRTHPDTGAKALYLGNHASHILGQPIAEGRALLDELLAHATQRRFVYAHRWQVGDLVMWDNRCLLHRAVANFELGKHRRILHRTVVKGTIPY